MKLLHSREPFNFCGLEDVKFENSKAVVLPVPYDSTASYISGMRHGPKAIIEASRHMELYDVELGYEPSQKTGVWTLDELQPSMDSPKETIKRVRDAFSEIMDNDRFPIMLGGEHSITLGAVQAVAAKYPKLSVLQIDAHSDLRDEFEGTKYNHACVMRRVREICPAAQVGIRSMCTEEAEFIRHRKLKGIFGTEFKIDDVVKELGENVYVTIDVDGFDPAEVPAVGTPEPGGLYWKQVMPLLRKVAEKKNIVGFDVVELCPMPGDIRSDFFCAKLAYKMLGYSFMKK